MSLNSELVKLKSLVPDKDNARIHNRKNIDAIKSSIEKFGQYRPFVVQKSTMRVAVGNGMLQAMLEMGLSEGSALFLELSDEDYRLLSIADNRSCDMSWDDPVMLLSLLKSIPDELMGLTGFTHSDLAILEYDSSVDNDTGSGHEPSSDNDSSDKIKFVFSTLHFELSKQEYNDWLYENDFNGMDNDNVSDVLKAMLGIENE